MGDRELAACRDERTKRGRRLGLQMITASFTIWVPGIKLRFSALVPNVFTHEPSFSPNEGLLSMDGLKSPSFSLTFKCNNLTHCVVF